jgi:MFS superfamily sulfate permease-like transporter
MDPAGLRLEARHDRLPLRAGVDGDDRAAAQALWRSGRQRAPSCCAALAPALPGTLIVLVGGIVVSALLDLKTRGVDVVGDLPSALPDPLIPDVGWADLGDLVPAALGVVIVTAEAIGVARAIASADGYKVDVNRDLVAFGGSNLLAGLSSGFVQSGGASQTMAAERSGGKTQLLSVVAAVLILLTGAFLTFLFEDLPQATLAAIVVVAIAGFFRVDELRRYAALYRLALVNALVALFGVLLLGVLPGLLVAVILSLIQLMQRLARPPLARLARDPATGTWGSAERHPGWKAAPDVLVMGTEGPLFFANALTIKDRIVAALDGAHGKPAVVVLHLSRNDEIDVGSLDMLKDLADTLAREGVELRLANVHANVHELLRRDGVADRVRIDPTLDAAGGCRAVGCGHLGDGNSRADSRRGGSSRA